MQDYKKLNNQPVKLVLAEFRFSPVMQIAEYIPRLQEALRRTYPISEKKNEQMIQVQPGGIAVSTLDRWSFISANRKSAVDINQERLIYYTAEYSGFNDFSDSCKQALDVLASIVEPTLIIRIGLRYGNLIKIDNGEKIADLVDAHFGFPNGIEELSDPQQQRNQQVVETFISTTIGGLAIRTLYGKHNLTCLRDLQALPIVIEKNETPAESLILDLDHFWEAKDETLYFQTNEILEKSRLLHETSRAAFWKLTTDYARNEKWV